MCIAADNYSANLRVGTTRLPSITPSCVRLSVRRQAVYEKAPHLAVATPELVSTSRGEETSRRSTYLQITKHLFETRIANAFIAFSGSTEAPGEAIGFALYFFNFSTWTGKPGLYVRRVPGTLEELILGHFA